MFYVCNTYLIIMFRIAYMQYRNNKTLQLVKSLGKIIKKYRIEKTGKSLNMFAYEYELTPGNISRIENGQIEPKIVMLWRIAEALNVPLSVIIKELENEMSESFSISDK